METQTNFPRAPELITTPIYTGNSPLSRVHRIAFSRLAASRRSRLRELAALGDIGGTMPIEMRIRTYVRTSTMVGTFVSTPVYLRMRPRFTDLHLKLKSRVSLGFIRVTPILIIDASSFYFSPPPFLLPIPASLIPFFSPSILAVRSSCVNMHELSGMRPGRISKQKSCRPVSFIDEVGCVYVATNCLF